MGVRGVEKCNRLQKIAVEESRLGIPLLIGLDVVHGLRTVFPIPLAESCCWSDEIFERSATGINWTFALMIYIARDARWGRVAEGPVRIHTSPRALPQQRYADFRGKSYPIREELPPAQGIL